MDLQTVNMLGGNRCSITRLAAIACFAVACALMIGSLIVPTKTYSVGSFGKPAQWNAQS